MATLCEADRLKKQAAHLLRNGLGNGLLDVSGVLAILERDSDCCACEHDDREAA
jgi:hypothetical protein